jgi:hypothetical protein
VRLSLSGTGRKPEVVAPKFATRRGVVNYLRGQLPVRSLLGDHATPTLDDISLTSLVLSLLAAVFRLRQRRRTLDLGPAQSPISIEPQNGIHPRSVFWNSSPTAASILDSGPWDLDRAGGGKRPIGQDQSSVDLDRRAQKQPVACGFRTNGGLMTNPEKD